MSWSHGGDFPRVATSEVPELRGPPITQLAPRATLWGSGRAALLALVEKQRFSRLWVPSYFCPEVPQALGRVAAIYADSPGREGFPDDVKPGEAVLRANVFGWRASFQPLREKNVVVIEDHTHDPWGPAARESRADWALASLRKTYPIADGALLWSPAGRDVPEEREATAEHLAAVDLKSRGMSMKRSWLKGAPVELARYSELLASGEARIGASVSGISDDSREMVLALSPEALAAKRRQSYAVLSLAMKDWLAEPGPAPGTTPFAVVLDVDARDRVLAALRRANVLALALWKLSSKDREAQKFSDRTLSIACDFRATPEDQERVIEVVRGVLG